jgi:glycosyltransferase involved in cell wall biosynthesis
MCKVSFGLTIVASSASGIPEIIENNVHGVLFRKADNCSLLSTLNWALDHPEKMEEFAANASVRVKEFSSEKMTDKTIGLIDALVAGNNEDHIVDGV